MAHIRYCNLRDTKVLITPKRAVKPYDFITEINKKPDLSQCPFEAGNESLSEKEIFSLRDENGNWKTRVVANLYNAVDIDKNKESYREGFFEYENALGAHEVLIETPQHEIGMHEYSQEQFKNYLLTIIERIKDLSKDQRLEFIQVFKNKGMKAGASISHPHSQIIATAFIPKKVEQEIKRKKEYFKKHKRPLLLDIVNEELRLNKRVISQNNTFVAFCPFASEYPFEILITRKNFVSSLKELELNEIEDLSQILQVAHQKLQKTLGDFDFNMIFKDLPTDQDNIKEYTGFYIQIIPRIYNLAGYELATEIKINPIIPETASSELNRG
jgi:UDPglucose--hexose-1-phosphate uridylyltransferase